MLILDDYSHDERTLRSHLSLIHGVYVADVKDLAGLVEAHETSHDDPDGHFCVNHGHRENVPIDEVEFAEDWFG